jgi:hypothetical protein
MRGCVMRTLFTTGKRGLGFDRGLGRDRGSRRTAVLRYVAGLALMIGVGGYGTKILWDAVLDNPSDSRVATSPPTTAAAVLETDSWTQSLRTEQFWSGRKAGNQSGDTARARSEAKSEARYEPKPDFNQRSGLTKTPSPVRSASATPVTTPKAAQPVGERTDGAEWYEGEGGTHRTVCVRLCDGYFWPISFSTNSDYFDRDKKTCEKSCGSPTRLFIHENPGQDVTEMVDMKGNAYSKLRTAYLFRADFDQSCKCNAHPWEQASKDRHRVYALEVEKRKGSQRAAVELIELKAAIVAARKAPSSDGVSRVKVAAVAPAMAYGLAKPAVTEVDKSASAVFAAPLLAPGPGVASGVARFGAPVLPVSQIVAGHLPLSATLLGALPSAESSVAGLAEVSASATVVANPSQRLAQLAQLAPPAPIALPLSGPGPSSAPGPLSGPQTATPLPIAPFALAPNAPVVPNLKLVSERPLSSIQTSSLARAAPPVSTVAPVGNMESRPKLAVSAPPIITAANAELGIPAPLPVNTAQLEQVNRPLKPVTAESSKVAEAKSEPKPQAKRADRPEPRVAASEPPPKPRRVEPRVVERREPEPPAPRRVVRAAPEPRAPDPKPEPKVRVVERAAPRPVRVVEAPRPKPQQVTVRNDTWRARAFEPR